MPAESPRAARPNAAAADQNAAQLSANAALRNAVERLLLLLDRETTALRTRQPLDMGDLSDRKNQALLELSRIGRRLEGEPVDGEVRALLADLRHKLEENRSVLKFHLQAVGEVADILATAIRDAESDGTYSTGAGLRWLA